MDTSWNCVRRAYATLIASIGGIVARSAFRDLHRVVTPRRIHNIDVVGRSSHDVELVMSALRNLSQQEPYGFKIVISWLHRLAFERGFLKWKHFCDGTLFVQSTQSLPPDRLAAYMYRVALEIMLFNRFGHREIFLNDPRTKLVVYRKELSAMKKLGCSNEYIEEQEIFVQRYNNKLPASHRKSI